MEAKFYTRLPERAVQCQLCPHECIIHAGRSGKCKVRTNISGVLYADSYDAISVAQFDPIEKKPLYHFYPGTEILSLGSVGCNFTCDCCQNYEISQTGVLGFPRFQEKPMDELVKLAKSKPENIGVAYTYNEPVVWYEYIRDLAEKVHAAGMQNVMVSNGYIRSKPLQELLPYVNAFNIDLKSFDAATHHKLTGGELPFVKHTLKAIVAAGKHLEITHLVVTGLNDTMDQFKDLPKWIADYLGPSVPLHLSRYFPKYKYNKPATEHDIILSFAEHARQYLQYVYIGNMLVNGFQETCCSECDTVVIQREGYMVAFNNLTADGKCNSCGNQIVIR